MKAKTYCVILLLINVCLSASAQRIQPTPPQILPITYSYEVFNNEFNKQLAIDHSDKNDPRSIQYLLNIANPGEEVVLMSDNTYRISDRLIIPNFVSLRGKHKDGVSWENQRISVSDNFPIDRSMILLKSEASIVGVHLDGNNTAWRIIKLQEHGQNYAIIDNTIENTENDLYDYQGFNSVLGGAFTHVDLIFARNSNNIEISGNNLYRAGLKSLIGKENNPKDWEAIGAGVSALACKHLIIKNNTISKTVTAGITIQGSEIVLIDNNDIEFTGRNIEWFEQNFGLLLGDGITGYHNNAMHAQPDLWNEELNWTISNNNISNSGNHGMHLGGKAISLDNNFIDTSRQTGIYWGDFRQPNECLLDVEINDLTVGESGYDLFGQFFIYNHPQQVVAPNITYDNYLRGFEDQSQTIIFSGLISDEAPFFDTLNSSCEVF
jgi:hypothetical protein